MTTELNLPLVSVGLPTRNRALTLRRALDSLLAQNYKNLELVLSDNASDDETEKICRQYAERDSRIKYFRQNADLSVLENYEFVFKNSKGKYFMWAADDDWWHPEFVSSLCLALETNPNYDVAMSSYARVYEDGSLSKIVRFTGALNVTRDSFEDVFKKMADEYPIHHFFYGLFRRAFLAKMMSRPIPFCKAMDRVFMCEAALAGHFYSVPEILWHKTDQMVDVPKRYGGRDIGRVYAEPKKHSRYVWLTVWRVISSPAIPFLRKIKIAPGCLIYFVWLNRVFLREWAPNLFDNALKFKKTWLW